jgi:hypothetical protein
MRNTLETLLAELFEGPHNPNQTWIVSNERESGILGTLRRIPAEQAKIVPDGLKHSIAEHVAHLHFSLDMAIARLRGDTPSADWKSSWNAGDFDDCAWQHMQRSLRESQLRLRMDVHDRHNFEHFEWTCGAIAALAHAAYHLAAIRQIAAILKATTAAPDLKEAAISN